MKRLVLIWAKNFVASHVPMAAKGKLITITTLHRRVQRPRPSKDASSVPSTKSHPKNRTDINAALMAANFKRVSVEARKSMRSFRQRYMYYSYRYDTLRYHVPRAPLSV
ncbi:hypothetical protein DH2020_042555 [Rehmannia glutinosa]|uniref:Xyloglucan endo-transglycosylase C-terminal domain-containing protein n=1 Tax=Rehmannia glutinosa TaxID=99300 RepID=A0ABR0UM35_REHGL